MTIRPLFAIVLAVLVSVPAGAQQIVTTGTSSMKAASSTSQKATTGPLSAVSFRNVHLNDGFLGARQEVNRTVTLPHEIKMSSETGRLSNFAKVAGKEQGKHEGALFNDSDVYKLMEAMAYSLGNKPDPKLEAQLDEMIALVAGAQQKDGYLNTFFTLAEPANRWKSFQNNHELYCAGHLIEAAVAHYQITGKRTFLDVATRFADYICDNIRPDKIFGIPGHEEIELALFKLWEATGNDRYRAQAEFFLNERGVERPGRKLYGEYCQDHMPLRDQSEARGHAVRAMYLFSGATDLAVLTGETSLVLMLKRMWEDVTSHRTYITGGIGNSAANEGFTAPYDLPNVKAYAETCAGIGLLFWNHRMNLLTGEAKYADLVERALYNGVLSGISLKGDTFYYENPLASDGSHHRQPWFGCACCPPNIARLLASLTGYFYAQRGSEVFVNLYGESSADLEIEGQKVRLEQKTRYPWDGNVHVVVDCDKPVSFTLCLRVPAWCTSFKVDVEAGKSGKIVTQNGYARVSGEWKKGESVGLDLVMPVQRLAANPGVAPDRGRVALMRGPIVYCLEAVDNPGSGTIERMFIPTDAKITSEWKPDLLGGVTILRGQAGLARPWEIGELYRPTGDTESATFTAVPYYAWDNREAGPMEVWIAASESAAGSLK